MSDTPRLDSRYVVKLGDKQYSTWPGVLDRAHQEGIQSITVDLVQVPSDDNGNVAICKATVTMKTGAIFEDYGDASPRNTNSKIVPHLIRMSSTRAKGRALRDAINVGECLLEELGGDEPGDRQGHYHDGGSGFKRAVERSADKWGATRAEIVNTPPVVGASLIEPPPQFLCVGCSKPMSQGQIKYCEANNLELLHPECRAKGYARWA